MPVSATDRIRQRVESSTPGWVFTPADLLDLGSPQLVGMTLLKLVRNGRVRRLARGIYDVPKSHPRLGLLSAPIAAVAEAIARRDGTTIQPSEATAANLLHLSDQVPAQVAFVTDGPSKVVVVGKVRLHFHGRSRRKVGSIAAMSSMVFAGLRSIGRRHVSNDRVRSLHQLLSAEDRHQLKRDLPKAPRWMHPFLRLLCQSEADPGRTRSRRKKKQRA